MFFSSDGHLGLGGLDVFVTDLSKKNENQTVINAGRPINSPEDDFAFYMIPDIKEAFSLQIDQVVKEMTIFML